MADIDREKRMRELLSEQATHSVGRTAIDADTVIARARRRRLPRQLAVGGASALAVVGLLTVAVPLLGGLGMSAGEAPMSASTLSSDGAERDSNTGATESAEDAGTEVCGAAAPGPRQIAGVDVTVSVLKVAHDDGMRIHAELELANVSDGERSAELESVLFTLSRDGVVIAFYEWPANATPGSTFGRGDTSRFSVEFTPVACDPSAAVSGPTQLSALAVIGGATATSPAVTIPGP